MCCINMVADHLCGICSDGSHSYSHNKHNIFQFKHGYLPVFSIPSFCITLKNHVHRPGNQQNIQILFTDIIYSLMKLNLFYFCCLFVACLLNVY